MNFLKSSKIDFKPKKKILILKKIKEKIFIKFHLNIIILL